MMVNVTLMYISRLSLLVGSPRKPLEIAAVVRIDAQPTVKVTLWTYWTMLDSADQLLHCKKDSQWSDQQVTEVYSITCVQVWYDDNRYQTSAATITYGFCLIEQFFENYSSLARFCKSELLWTSMNCFKRTFIGWISFRCSNDTV